VAALADTGTVEVAVLASFREVLAILDDDIVMVAVDIPIGLPEAGRRACDVAARRHLGPRRSSVFPAPPRPLLGVHDYGHALTMKQALDGRGLSKQAFHLLPKIAEVDAALDADDQRAVVESHPELAFARLKGRPADNSKRSEAGLAERRDLLRGVVGSLPSRPRGAGEDDLVDAVALTITARRLAEGTAERVGDRTHDARGLVMQIAW